MKGWSIGYVARRYGLAVPSVKDAIRRGSVRVLDDGSLDPESVKEHWETSLGRKPLIPEGPNTGVSEDVRAIPTLAEVRRTNELLKAQLLQLEVQQRKGILVDKREMLGRVLEAMIELRRRIEGIVDLAYPEVAKRAGTKVALWHTDWLRLAIDDAFRGFNEWVDREMAE